MNPTACNLALNEPWDLLGRGLDQVRGGKVRAVFGALALGVLTMGALVGISALRLQGAAEGVWNHLQYLLLGGSATLLACAAGLFFLLRPVHEWPAVRKLLKSSEEKFQALAQEAADCFLTTDTGGIITDANPTAEFLFGYSKEEMVGRPLSLLMPQKFNEEFGSRSFGEFVSRTLGVHASELYGRKKDGVEFPLEVSLSRWTSGNGVFYTAIVRDTTERKFFVKTLLKNEHRLFQFLDAIPMGVLVRDPTGAPYYANQKAKEIFGPEVFQGTEDSDSISEGRRFYRAGTDQLYPNGQLPILKALDGEKSHVDDIEMRLPDRSIFLESWGTPISDENGQVKFALSSVIDVTGQKQMTESLKEREEFFRNLFEEGPIGMALTSAEGSFVGANRAFLDMLGCPKKELMGHPASDFLHPDDAPADLALSGKLFSKQIPKYQVEQRYVTRNRGAIWCKVSASMIRDMGDEPLFRLIIAENIHEQKTSEMVLRESEGKFRTLTESANDAIISSDSRGQIIFFNPAAERAFGYSQAEVLGRPISHLMSETSWKKNFPLIQNYLVSGKATIPGRFLEMTAKRKGGQEFPATVSYFSWKTDAGLFFTAIVRDITEQKEAEKALKESEERFRAVTDSAHEAIVSVDSQGRVIYSNSAAERLFGFSRREMQGNSLITLLSEKSRGGHEEEFRRAFAGGTSPLVGRSTEWTGLSRQGREFPLELSLYTWFTDAGVFATAILRDITERKQIEEMKNELVSVVSHQLKTPVAEINGYIENMLDGLTGDLTPRQKEYLADMRDISQENYRLISDLLSMSKIERGVVTVALKPVSLRQVVDASTRDYAAAIQKKGLQLALEMGPEEILVQADAEKTVETVRNILNNAIKCTDEGSITIKAAAQGGFGVIEVRDTGIGMSPETLKRLFTKERVLGSEASRSGAGLGLFIAKRFMELQNGRIYVSSELGRGSTLSVKLPLFQGGGHD